MHSTAWVMLVVAIAVGVTSVIWMAVIVYLLERGGKKPSTTSHQVDQALESHARLLRMDRQREIRLIHFKEVLDEKAIQN